MLWTGSQRGLRGRVLRIALRPWARRSTVLCLVLASRYPPTSTPPAAFLRASVTPVGANPTRLRQFEGSGDYYAMGSVGAPSTGEYFIVYSVGAGESFGNTMLFSWYDAGPLTVGDYPIHEPQGGPEETRKGSRRCSPRTGTGRSRTPLRRVHSRSPAYPIQHSRGGSRFAPRAIASAVLTFRAAMDRAFLRQSIYWRHRWTSRGRSFS